MRFLDLAIGSLFSFIENNKKFNGLKINDIQYFNLEEKQVNTVYNNFETTDSDFELKDHYLDTYELEYQDMLNHSFDPWPNSNMNEIIKNNKITHQPYGSSFFGFGKFNNIRIE